MSPIFDKHGEASCPGGYSYVDDICVPRPEDEDIPGYGRDPGDPAGSGTTAGTPTTASGVAAGTTKRNQNQNQASKP